MSHTTNSAAPSLTASVEGAPPRRRAGAALPRAATDEEATGSWGQSGAASRGAPPGPIPRLLVARISSSATSVPHGRTSSGSATFLSALLGRARLLRLLARRRMIVCWQLATHMRTDLVLDAVRMALGQRGSGADVELMHHSDRGSQYTSIDYMQTLADHRVLASMGSVGDAYDNARRVVPRQLQDRVDRRPFLAFPQLARARGRRVHRLVQRRPSAREPRPNPRRPWRGGEPDRVRRGPGLLARSCSYSTGVSLRFPIGIGTIHARSEYLPKGSAYQAIRR